MHVRDAVGTVKGRIPSIFLALLFKLRQWCLNPKALLEPDHEDVSIFDDEQRNHRNALLASVMEAGHPRITEHISSDEGSPQTLNSSNSRPMAIASSTSETARTMPEAGTAAYEQSAPQLQAGINTSSIDYTTGAPGYSNASAASSGVVAPIAQQPNYTAPSEPMNIDDNLFQFLGNMNTFPEGGLTGLDDWANIAQDLSGMSAEDMMNWQFPPPAGGPT